MRLYLIRHGETEYNQNFRFLGRTDIGLSERGERQAKAIAERLRGEAIDVVYSSDLARARQTAEVIALPHGLSAIPLKELREIDFGRWEGLTYEEIRAIDEEYVELWVNDPFTVNIPEGEPWAVFKARLIGALEVIIKEAPGAHVAIVSHGGPIKLLVSYFKSDDKAFLSFWPSPGSISIIDIADGAAQIISLNESPYDSE